MGCVELEKHPSVSTLRWAEDVLWNDHLAVARAAFQEAYPLSVKLVQRKGIRLWKRRCFFQLRLDSHFSWAPQTHRCHGLLRNVSSPCVVYHEKFLDAFLISASRLYLWELHPSQQERSRDVRRNRHHLLDTLMESHCLYTIHEIRLRLL